MSAARILVVEDERIVALQIRRQLTGMGYDVPATVSSGDRALLEIQKSPPDLVLMDINIEGSLDGIATAAQIPIEYHIPVIYLTAYSEDEMLKRASATNSYGYLLKPFSERELHATIQMTLARCRAETALRAAEERLRQLRKMEAIAKIAGGLAHDFNNLLTIIYGNLELLGDYAASHPEISGPIQKVFNAALKEEKLVRSLLAFSQQQPLCPNIVSVNAVVSNMSTAIRQALGKSVGMKSRLPVDLWPIHIDVEEFETALLNLADNARDAMPNGGDLSIEGSNIVVDPEYPDAQLAATPGRYVCISVIDSGTGMPEHVIERAFEPYFTTRPAGHAAGLGLSQVFGFVRQSGGHISLISEHGTGTTARLYLPAAFDAVAVIEQPVEVRRADPIARPGEVVLVVEDEPLVLRQVVLILARLGYSTIEAGDASVARELLRGGERIDLLLTDVIMPVGDNGAMLAHEALVRRPDLRVLYMSGYTDSVLVRDGVLDPGVSLLCKPFTRNELAHKVREVLDLEPRQ